MSSLDYILGSHVLESESDFVSLYLTYHSLILVVHHLAIVGRSTRAITPHTWDNYESFSMHKTQELHFCLHIISRSAFCLWHLNIVVYGLLLLLDRVPVRVDICAYFMRITFSFWDITGLEQILRLAIGQNGGIINHCLVIFISTLVFPSQQQGQIEP